MPPDQSPTGVEHLIIILYPSGNFRGCLQISRLRALSTAMMRWWYLSLILCLQISRLRALSTSLLACCGHGRCRGVPPDQSPTGVEHTRADRSTFRDDGVPPDQSPTGVEHGITLRVKTSPLLCLQISRLRALSTSGIAGLCADGPASASRSVAYGR